MKGGGRWGLGWGTGLSMVDHKSRPQEEHLLVQLSQVWGREASRFRLGGGGRILRGAGLKVVCPRVDRREDYLQA